MRSGFFDDPIVTDAPSCVNKRGRRPLPSQRMFAASFASRLRPVYHTGMPNTTPKVKVPHGFSLIQTPTGYEVVANGETMTRTVAFRLPASLYADVAELVETFPQRTFAAALRWMLADEEIRRIIKSRIDARTTQAK